MICWNNRRLSFSSSCQSRNYTLGVIFSVKQLTHHGWLSSTWCCDLILVPLFCGFWFTQLKAFTEHIVYFCLLVYSLNIKHTASFSYDRMERVKGNEGQHYTTLKVHYLSIFADVVKELSSWDILHYHEDICWGANNLIPVVVNTKF